VQLGDYVTLYRLAKARLDSPEAYQTFQRFQGQLLVRYLASRGCEVKGRRVLDLGCGFGGYSLALRDGGAQVVCLDLEPEHPFDGLPTICANALCTPLASGSFDMVVCASLIEHVPSAADLMAEIYRLVKPGGLVYLSFPPFYTPIGGHQFSPFHLLGERAALAAFRLRGRYHGTAWIEEHFPGNPQSFTEAWGDWGLYPRTIAGVEKIVCAFPLRLLERSTRWLPVDFSGVPLLGEFLTWHVQFLLRKLTVDI